MKKTFFGFAAALLLNFSAFGSNGGATTVGDGGHTITCNGKTELFDLYEYRIHNQVAAPLTLGNKKEETKKLVRTGLHRLREMFDLNDMEYSRVKRAAKVMLLDNQFRIDQQWLNTYSFSANPLQTSMHVYRQMAAGGCSVDTAVVRPPLNPFFMELCRHNLGEYEFCFITISARYWELNRAQRACLVIHEALRFLPTAKKLHSEAELRAITADICTQ